MFYYICNMLLFKNIIFKKLINYWEQRSTLNGFCAAVRNLKYVVVYYRFNGYIKFIINH